MNLRASESTSAMFTQCLVGRARVPGASWVSLGPGWRALPLAWALARIPQSSLLTWGAVPGLGPAYLNFRP